MAPTTLRVIAIAALLVLVHAETARCDEQDTDAALAVEKLGGKVRRNEKVKGAPIVGIELAVTKTEDRDLKVLAGLNALEELDLRATRVTDAGMATLKHLRNLKSLDLTSTRVSDIGLKALKDLRNLEELSLI